MKHADVQVGMEYLLPDGEQKVRVLSKTKQSCGQSYDDNTRSDDSEESYLIMVKFVDVKDERGEKDFSVLARELIPIEANHESTK